MAGGAFGLGFEGTGEGEQVVFLVPRLSLAKMQLMTPNLAAPLGSPKCQSVAPLVLLEQHTLPQEVAPWSL